MQDDTREKLLAAAKKQFAERGFYGASIAQVAGELGLTKQALLYHFKRKEDLYAHVMRDISERLMRFIDGALKRDDSPEAQLEHILMGLYMTSREHPLDTRLLVRELLDNQSRAESAKDWYLLPFLKALTDIAGRMKGFEKVPEETAFCMIYQLLGSIEYFAISTPTLTRMYGAEAYERFSAEFPTELRNQIRRLIESHKA